MREKIRIHWPGILLILLTIITGLSTYQEYGINWDDPYQRNIGLVNYDYITKNDQGLTTYMFKEYGPGFELLLVFIEKQMRITDSRDIYLMRHLATHLLFLASACCFYLLAFRLYKKTAIACLCFLMIVLAPRIYAHSFFNTKDIPFFAAISIGLYLGTIALEKRKTTLFFLTGFFCGMATSIRIMGIMLFAFILTYLIIDLIRAFAKRENKGTYLKHILLFSLAYGIAVYACYPFLWAHPAHNFVHVFKAMSHYNWSGTIFQNGRFIQSDNIPWYVFFVWFFITNPVLWLVLGFGGIIIYGIHFFKNPRVYFTGDKRIFLLYFLCFITPIAAVIGLHSVIYEDWRHLFFVYPPFVLFAAYFVDKLQKSKLKAAVAAAIISQVVVTGYTMYKTFPLNQIYFNPLIAHSDEYLRKHYEMDYWGVSCKQGLDHILSTDQRQLIIIATDRATYPPMENNTWMLPQDTRKRVQLVLAGKDVPFDYFVTDFRCHPDDYDYPVKDYSIKAFNSTVLGIYKMK